MAKIHSFGNGIVYLYTNTVNGKKYVGITMLTLRHRTGQHPTADTYLGRSIRKYGRDAFNVEVIDNAGTKEELYEKEKYWIKELNTLAPNGYNMNHGGDGINVHTEETRLRISISKLGKPRPDLKPEDLTGQKFGRLTAKTLVAMSRGKNEKYPRCGWICLCDCGKEHTTTAQSLKAGKCKSCGCLQIEIVGKQTRTHGKSDTREFSTWLSIRERCLSQSSSEYFRYGGRGITVCDRWLSSFENFYADMGSRPEGKYILCRRDQNRNFCPENCFWGSRKDNGAGKRRWLEAGGERKILSDWARELNVTHTAIVNALKRGTSFQTYWERHFTESI